MKQAAILPFLLLLCSCGDDGYSYRPNSASYRPAYGQYGGYSPGATQSYNGNIEARVSQLERNLYALAARVCHVEGVLDPVTFSFPANGGVVIYRSGQAPRQC